MKGIETESFLRFIAFFLFCDDVEVFQGRELNRRSLARVAFFAGFFDAAVTAQEEASSRIVSRMKPFAAVAFGALKPDSFSRASSFMDDHTIDSGRGAFPAGNALAVDGEALVFKEFFCCLIHDSPSRKGPVRDGTEQVTSGRQPRRPQQ